ncbi:metal-sulfur cluster assembly factor [Candidatus Woesearchaeota archaeon]|jgi:metal-sulfur cluster biosynthetic enzyme|nr:metal-sulfur cluster assembly factor [Candidatus Woesearchaeota archaeon]MBT4247719.1 metal-sulfur cluster assembly factor [Candidatus Woesearchaeota archaeon]MBT5215973.1 metal-sulfur cluster assembly factor [Candidatus Woesearchaeota archaeon]MBT7332634.1 metal-sulfur cluster assembly factor [Candidatus Woesearchaeota archaeon]
MVTKEEIIKKIELCIDPDLGIDLWTLGLIYDIKIEKDNVEILMTFTSPMCPYGPEMVKNVEDEVKSLGVEVKVNVTFEPAWTPSEELREMLGV